MYVDKEFLSIFTVYMNLTFIVILIQLHVLTEQVDISIFRVEFWEFRLFPTLAA